MTRTTNAPTERLTFAEFVERIGVRKYLREAFEAHVRMHGGSGHRTVEEWQRMRSDFLQQHRGRR
jgi:hypothetical protein